MRNGWSMESFRDRDFEGSRRGREEWEEREPRFEREDRGGPMARWMSRHDRGDEESYARREAPIVKVIEVVAQSPHSWEDAARRAISETSRTVRDIRSMWIEDMTAVVSRDHIVEFRLVAKISFAVHPEARSRRAHA